MVLHGIISAENMAVDSTPLLTLISESRLQEASEKAMGPENDGGTAGARPKYFDIWSAQEPRQALSSDDDPDDPKSDLG